MDNWTPSFHCALLPAVGEAFDLDAHEARHAAGARRLKSGDPVVVFDGSGGIGSGQLVRVERRAGVRVVLAQRWAVPPPAAALHLVCAVPKAERLATLLDMATQLGMTAFTPLVCERSRVASSFKMQRWQRIVLEACKQSRRAWLPAIHPPLAFAAACTAPGAGEVAWLADPAGTPVGDLPRPPRGSLPDGRLVIGPEGGFTNEERAAWLAAGARPVRFGTGVLRVETAAVALIGGWQAWAGA